MPPKARTHCKVEGCGQPVHVFPGGWRCSYCREHMHHRKAKVRDGQPSMTGQMLDVLRYLRAVRGQDGGMVPLAYPLAHGITLHHLIDRDWIVEDAGYYGITGRGLKALALYEPRRNRSDGVCPRCGQRPRHVRSSGMSDAYCLECLRARGRKRTAEHRNQGDPDRMCSRCHEKPRHRYSGGHVSTYCADCERERSNAKSRRAKANLLNDIRAGAPVPLCQHCKQKPRRVFANSISNYCADCGPRLMRRWKLNRALKHTYEGQL